MVIYPCAVQYIFVTYFIHSSLYLSISYTNLAPPPPPYLSQLVITNLSLHLSPFLFCYIHSFHFLDSTCKWKHTAFCFFFYVWHFTKHNTLYVHSCCCKRQNFISFYPEYYYSIQIYNAPILLIPLLMNT